MKTNGKSTPRDVILTTAFGLPFPKARLFFDSLKSTGYAGRIVVFTANLGRRSRSLYAAAGAEVIDHGVHLHRVLRRPLQMLFWKSVRMRPDAGSFSTPWDRLQQPNLLRWSLYRRFLAEHAPEFDRVLLVDLRDVFFQRDPFDGVDPDFVTAHLEEGNMPVLDSPWNSLAMRRAFGREGFEKWGHLRVSCSGVVSGGITAVRAYLDAFARLLPEVRMPDHGTDQALHIRLVGEEIAPVVRLCGNREGDAVQLAGVGRLDSIPRDSQKRLLNAAGIPFAIVHQFDRHPILPSQLSRRVQKQA
ncbi:MAG: hypothetical protein FGM15_11595 [Chthoniobacterales bacterium]|nr:hypothetical protein [Chthoniobacterales bacterium]